jgi:hypothetical protein
LEGERLYDVAIVGVGINQTISFLSLPAFLSPTYQHDKFSMKYLNIKISISGTSNGANVDYGARILEVELPSDFDEEKFFSECARAIYVAETR